MNISTYHAHTAVSDMHTSMLADMRTLHDDLQGLLTAFSGPPNTVGDHTTVSSMVVFMVYSRPLVTGRLRVVISAPALTRHE